jgi:hypothetical protein
LSANFPQVSKFSMCCVWTNLFLRSNESSLALCKPSNCSSGQDLFRFKTCFSFSAIHTSLHVYHVMLCVFLVDFARDFRHSLNISSHPMIFIMSSVILLSLCAFRILNFCWDIFLEIVCIKILLCLCVGLIMIFMPYE